MAQSSRAFRTGLPKSCTSTPAASPCRIRFYFSIFGVAIDLNALPIAEIIIVLSVAAMFIASLLAVFEQNVKRMLAYSSVAQIGYITLGIRLANQAGLTGGLVHLVNHALMKAALFLPLGAVFYRACTCSSPISPASAAGCRSPWRPSRRRLWPSSARPAPAGFISKWYLAVGAFEQGLVAAGVPHRR